MWGPTVTSYIVASTGAAAVVGGSLAGIRLLVLPEVDSRFALIVVAAVILLGLALDVRLAGRNLPGPRRQVNDQWLYRYRGWVYGIGFGVQLGIGFATVVSISSVYTVFAISLLAPSVMTGAVIAGTFGLIRSLPLLAVARVRTADQVVAIDGRLARWTTRARRYALVAEAALACVIALSLVG